MSAIEPGTDGPSEDGPPPHRLGVRVYYEDTDFSGFVYHASYLRFLERGRTELLRALAEFPRVVAAACELREPHRIARYLESTAGTFHRFYDNCRVLPMGDEEPGDLHRARLLLVAATRTVFENGLGLLGVSAPERM